MAHMNPKGVGGRVERITSSLALFQVNLDITGKSWKTECSVSW